MPKLTGKHTLPTVVSKTASSATPKYVSSGTSSTRRNRNQHSPSGSRSQSPLQRHSGSSPAHNKSHTGIISGYDSDHSMNISDSELLNPQGTEQQTPTIHSFLLTNFDSKFQTPKRLLQQLLKYVPREKISQIVPTRNGIIIKSPDEHLASTIRNKHSYQIFGSEANLTSMSTRTTKIHHLPAVNLCFL